jgi:hypothetical protein
LRTDPEDAERLAGIYGSEGRVRVALGTPLDPALTALA